MMSDKKKYLKSNPKKNKNKNKTKQKKNKIWSDGNGKFLSINHI